MQRKLDAKDRKILDVLAQHADHTTRSIGKKTGLPATTVHNRIQRMRKDGAIRKYTIVPDHHAIGEGLLAYVLISVDLRELKAKKRTQEHVVRDLLRYHSVKRADIVSGGTDILATVRCQDIAQYNTVLLHKIQLIDGIENTQSLIVINEGEK